MTYSLRKHYIIARLMLHERMTKNLQVLDGSYIAENALNAYKALHQSMQQILP